MAFNETRIADDVERGAEGGPSFKTGVAVQASGRETRLGEWETTRGEWDIGYGLQSKALFDVVKAAFYAQRGRLNGFRFKDWSDFEMPDQQIALGDDSTVAFQVFKQYVFGSTTFNRDLTKIVSGSVIVKLDAVAIADPADYSIDLNTGIITMVVAPASTGGTAPGGEEILSVECEFDIPVRFDTDSLRVAMTTFDAGAIPSIPIVELKDE